MTLREELEPYRDKWGLIHPTRACNSRNGLLYKSLSLIALNQAGDIDWTDKAEFAHILTLCEFPLLNRTPDDRGLEAQDDYFGVAAALGVLGMWTQARQLLQYAKEHHWLFNNEDPDGRWRADAWLGRFPFFRAHLYAAANETPPIWLQIWWNVVLFKDVNPADQDGTVMAWLATRVGPPTWVARRWQAHLKAKCLGIGSVIGANFQDMSHPLARALHDV